MICVSVFLLLTLTRAGLGSLQEKQNDFGLKVFSQVAEDSVDQNLALSPYGVASVMAMAQLGADGDTYRALTAAMGFSLRGEWVTDLAHLSFRSADILGRTHTVWHFKLYKLSNFCIAVNPVLN